MKNRKQPIHRKVPIKRKTPLPRRTRIKPVSHGRSKMLAAYRSAKRKYMEENPDPVCWVCNNPITSGSLWDFHHPWGRASMEDILRFQPVHRACHDKIHSNMKWAREKGFIFY